MKKLLRPSGGHILDIDSLETGDQFLNLAKNVHTRKGFPSRQNGRRVAYPVVAGGAPNDPLHILNLQLNTFNWWMLFGGGSIYAIEGTNYYDITMLAPAMSAVTDPYEWTSTLLNGIPVFSNGKNKPMFWNGSGASDAAEIAGFPAATSVKCIVAFRFHLFGLNVDGPGGTFDNQIIWSDATDPGALPTTWTPAPSNEAGSAILADTPGRCVCGMPLGAQLFIYKPQSVYPVEYAGQQPDNIFVVRPANRSIGALGPHTVCDLGDRHLVLGNDDVVLFDGVNVRSIAENRVKTAIANAIDATYAQNAFVVRDLNKREVWVCIPESGSRYATIAHIWDERRDTWVTRDLNLVRHGTVGYVTDTTPSETWNSDSQVWDLDLSAWNAGSVGSITRVTVAELNKMYVEDTTDALSITATLAKYDMALDDDAQNKLVQKVWIRGTGIGFADIEFRLGSRQTTDDTVSWQGWQTADADGNLSLLEISGRYISLEIRATSDDTWTIDRVLIEARYNGAY